MSTKDYIDGYEDGEVHAYESLCHEEQNKIEELIKILTDLIIELRDHEHDAPDAGECSICDELDRAEQRMREVQGE